MIALRKIHYLYCLFLFHHASLLRFLNNTHITTGAPTKAVTELTGIAPSNPGILAIRLHSNAKEAPPNNEAGRIVA